MMQNLHVQADHHQASSGCRPGPGRAPVGQHQRRRISLQVQHQPQRGPHGGLVQAARRRARFQPGPKAPAGPRIEECWSRTIISRVPSWVSSRSRPHRQQNPALKPHPPSGPRPELPRRRPRRAGSRPRSPQGPLPLRRGPELLSSLLGLQPEDPAPRRSSPVLPQSSVSTNTASMPFSSSTGQLPAEVERRRRPRSAPPAPRRPARQRHLLLDSRSSPA